MSTSSETHNLDDCAAFQREEWEVLEAIYPDCLSIGSTNGVIKLEVPVELLESTDVSIHSDVTVYESSSDTGSSSPRMISLTTLPPILLDLCLPPAYPFSPPQIISVHATHSWLLRPRETELRDCLAEKWEKGEGVLYSWVEWIRSSEFLDELHLTATANGKRTIRIPHPSPGILLPALENFNQSIQTTRFSQSSFECQVCLTSVKGARCIMLSCSHVFCRSCLEDFWKLCIKEGDVGRVGCPDPACVKGQREASEEEVRRVVTEEEVIRWKWLHKKRALEKDPTLAHCPIPMCQAPVPRASNVEEGSPWERLRTCSQCGYSFCSYCKRTWHGPVSRCSISATKKIVLEYMALVEDSSERKQMDMRYGRINLQRLVAEYEQERSFHEWLERSTGSPCPGCDLRVEKYSGCNHMECCRCRTHYCYRCGARLDRLQPYKHFSTPGLRCFSKLFDVESIDDEWQPVEGFEVLT